MVTPRPPALHRRKTPPPEGEANGSNSAGIMQDGHGPGTWTPATLVAVSR